MKKRYYANNSMIPNKIEWANCSKILLYLFIFCMVTVVLNYIFLRSIESKVKREKDLAFRAGYAKALMMDELPEVLPY